MLLQNELFDGTYRILRQIGRGGTAEIYLAYHIRLKKNVVLKRINGAWAGIDALRTETDILKNLHHPCLPQVYDFICSGADVYTVMDYVEGQSLEKLPSGPGIYRESQLVHWLRQLAEVLDYLHTRRPAILHSDIKPENIILSSTGQLYLIDFNISLNAEEQGKVSGYSTNFASPEQAALAAAIVECRPRSFALDARTDIYSLAATFYYLMTGIFPHCQRLSVPLCQMQGLPYSVEFMALIDRAMSWDREKRYPSAKKLLQALDRLKKQDVRYRRYLWMQACSWLVSAALAAAGLFCVVRSGQESRLEAYRRDYEAFFGLVEQEGAQAEQCGLDLLNDARYRAMLERQPQDRALILHALGDICYDAEDYEGAQRYYSDALDAALAAGITADRYYLDDALALARSGRSEQAEQALQEAQNAGAAASACALMRAGLAFARFDPEMCAGEAQTVLDSTEDREVCARACLLAAQAWQANGQTLEEIAWLERARAYSDNAGILRRMGAACASQIERQSFLAQQESWAKKALECYRELCSRAQPTLEDRINCAIMYYVLGQPESCRATLLPCEQEDPYDHRIQGYLALAYDALGDAGNAAVHCSQALRRIAELPEDRRSGIDGGLQQELTRLQRQLGI